MTILKIYYKSRILKFKFHSCGIDDELFYSLDFYFKIETNESLI